MKSQEPAAIRLNGNSYFVKDRDPMLAEERYRPLKLTPLMPGFGARIDGFDIRSKVEEPVKDALREAFLRFGVLIFTGQELLSPDEHVGFARIFGVPDEGALSRPKVAKHIDLLENSREKPPTANLWHTDNLGFPNAGLGSVIQIREIPTIGGNTTWASARQAYQCLSQKMKDFLEGQLAVHYWDQHGYVETRSDFQERPEWYDQLAKLMKEAPPREVPIIMSHPITGEKVLFVNETFTRFVRNVHKYESVGILHFLFSWMKVPEFHLVHTWTKNDVAIWDNLSMQHYALGDYNERRVNHRVEFGPDPDIDYQRALNRDSVRPGLVLQTAT